MTKVYSGFHDWRPQLYAAIADHALRADELRTLAFDMRQTLERIEAEVERVEATGRDRRTPSLKE
jgi:hypothetical protein